MSGVAAIRHGQALLRTLRRQTSCVLGGVIVAIVLLTALLAPWIAPHDPVEIDIVNSLLPPDGTYLLGTDQGGRDVLSRIIWGTRVSLTVSLLAVVIGVGLGTLLGLFAAWHRGRWIEQMVMRVMDMIASIPLLIWAIALVGIIGVQPMQVGPLTLGNEHKLLVLIGLLYVPSLTRVTHDVALGEMQADYVRARRVEGASAAAIVLGDVLPNCLSPILVQATLLIAAGIVVEASVSFIGLGVQPPLASWGAMLADARNYVFSPEWWLPVFPGLAISLTVIGFNLLGDGLRDALDPRRVTRGMA
jgi:peptide/nickel transport system permease protein